MSQYPALPPDEQDERLKHTGEASIFQRIRLLTNEERDTLDKVFASGELGDLLRGKKPTATLRSIQSKIPDLMERLQLTDEVLLEKWAWLMHAKETRFFQKDGVVTDTREVEALGIQRAATEALSQMRGMYTAHRADVSEREYERNITVNMIHVGARP